jgi:hypothetical protein
VAAADRLVLVLLGTYAAAAVKRLGRRRDREAIFSPGGLCGLLGLLRLHESLNAHIPANALFPRGLSTVRRDAALP